MLQTPLFNSHVNTDRISIDCTSGSGVDGKYDVASVPNANSFTYTAGTSLTTSGNAAYNVMTPTWGSKSMVFIKAADYSTTYRVKVKNAAGTSTLADVSTTTAAVGGSAPDTGGTSGYDIHAYTIMKKGSSGTYANDYAVIANHSMTS